MLTKIKKSIRKIQSAIERVASPSSSKAYAKAVRLGLFDAQWYQEHYGSFPYKFAAFKDYLDKSTFANVNPSAKFDTEYYHRRNTDLYLAGKNPLLHYMYHGRFENRDCAKVHNKWVPTSELIAEDVSGWKEQKIAIVLHIYYDDFVEKFAKCVAAFPCNVDVFVAAGSHNTEKHAQKVFNDISTVNQVYTCIAENRGRNFGPFLIHFAKQLLEYDLMCHAHSKKSLYSGREQTQWFDYLNQFLLKDKHVVKSVLRLFRQNEKLGIYYPTSFWMMPAWVNHWTCNKAHAAPFVNDWELDISANFINYPVGGMFWARPVALKQLLNTEFTYKSFPVEPLPNDGSYLHALERVLGLLVEKNNFEQFFYYPPLGKFTQDKSYISANYFKHPEQLKKELGAAQIVSFDVFDTVLRRKYSEPDYAKTLLAKKLIEDGLISSVDQFIALRNEAEYCCREQKQFQGDVSIFDAYEEIAQRMGLSPENGRELAQKEFELDLSMALPKDEMVNIAQHLHESGKEIWFITDIYYTTEQIALMLKHIGIAFPYRLFVSSDLQKRKDAGTMWTYIKELTDSAGKTYVHVGDNVRSDAQICGDFGLQNMHILHPDDKWQIAGMPNAGNKVKQETDILKWGRLKSNFGRYPFFGE